MIRDENLKDVPHFNLIVENEIINIPSVFMFKNGCKELFPFLYACKEYNCTVYFVNENLTVTPYEEVYQNMLLTIYAHIAEYPKIANDYIRYLSKIDDMTWACLNAQ